MHLRMTPCWEIEVKPGTSSGSPLIVSASASARDTGPSNWRGLGCASAGRMMSNSIVCCRSCNDSSINSEEVETENVETDETAKDDSVLAGVFALVSVGRSLREPLVLFGYLRMVSLASGSTNRAATERISSARKCQCAELLRSVAMDSLLPNRK